MVYSKKTNATNMSWLCKIVFLLWMLHVRGAVKQKLDCEKEERKINIACEGENITLTCPETKPRMKISSATFGRTEPETKVCLRPGNSNSRQLKHVQCEKDVAMKVTAICAGQRSCFFHVDNETFPDPCPAGVYKYIWVNFECSCRRRYTRSEAGATSRTCRPRQPNGTSSTYTVIHPTSALSTIGQSMTQNTTHSTIVINSKYIINSTYAPIIMTTRPTSTVRTQTVKATVSIEVSPNVTQLGRLVRERNKVFFLLLELFVIYNEAANEDPPMALMWCFIGILLGLFIIIITFLILGLKRKEKKKDLFRLSEIESEGEGVETPTIHATSQFPESPDSDRRRTAVGQLNATRNGFVSKHFPGMGSWSDLLKADTSLYINPLWRGWQDEYLSLTAQNREEELDAGQKEREGRSSSEPWNLSAPTQDRNINNHDNDFNGDGASNGNSNRNSTNSDGSNQPNSGNDSNNNTTIQDDEQPNTSHTNPEQSQPSTSNTRPSRVPTNKRRSIGESDPSLNSIPVGIPSHPITDPRIFHTEPPRTRKPDDTKHEAIETIPHVSGHDNELKKEKRYSFDSKNPSNKLLSKFGIEVNDNCITPSLCNTAMSSPCLYNEEYSEQTSGTHDLKDSSHPMTSSSLKVRSKPIRSRSLDFYNPLDQKPLHNTYNTTQHSPMTNKLPIQNPTANSPTISQHQNKPPPFVKNKDNQNLWPKVQVSGNQAQNESPQNIPVAKRPTKKSPIKRRTSSGYYSNSTSPLVEYPLEINSAKCSTNKAEQKPKRQMSINQQKSEDDDLPPLPPPPAPLIPISPLPHMCISGYPETKRDDNNPSRTAARKVHFKSSK